MAQADGKHKIYLSMSYIGNDWQAEAANMLSALAASKDYVNKVDLKIQVAGPSAQRQIQQINAMVQAGAEAIIVYPVSPTALNQVVKNACDKGVKIFAYDSAITEPCAYWVGIDAVDAGRQVAQWLVDKLHGKGNVVMLNGVPGMTADSDRITGAKEVFAKYPDIKVVSELVAMWSQAVTRTEMTKLLATRGWDQIDGIWAQAACFTVNSLEIESGIKPDQLKPCAGESDNGARIQMLPASTVVEGMDGTYRPMGAPGISYASMPITGAMALKLAVDALEGKDVPHKTVLEQVYVTNANVKLCETGSWEEMKAGCNVFPPSIVTNPGWFAQLYNKDIPELGLSAALFGRPEY
jgi:ribose transport system substrate-binding protein